MEKRWQRTYSVGGRRAHSPSLARSLLFSHGVLSLLGNTEVYCSVLVSSPSLSLSLPPLHPSISTIPPLILPPLSVHNPLLRQWGSLCSTYHSSHPSLSSSPLLPHLDHAMSAGTVLSRAHVKFIQDCLSWYNITVLQTRQACDDVLDEAQKT